MLVLRLAVTLLLLCRTALAVTSAADIARQIQENGLDAAECYRVVDLNFSKEDIRVYFTSGYLIFAKPVNGVRTSALFTADVEGGDAELLLLPPIRSERLSLANFTESPNLNQHFKSALLIFSDNTGDELLGKLTSSAAKRAPEMGAMLADKWTPVARNLTASFQVRLVADTLNSQRASGFFYMTVGGTQLGNFDVFYDPNAEENILVGQIAQRKNVSFFDVWTSFPSRSRLKSETAPSPDMKLENFRIEATLDADLKMTAVTRVTGTPLRPLGRAVSFLISQKMQVLEAKVDGQPAEVFQKDSFRSNLINANGNEQFLVVTPADLEPGKPHEFEIRHAGTVITKAGDQVFFVGSRGNWYPRRSLDFARYDLTFRYPKELSLVANGEVVEDHTEGNLQITRRNTTTPIRFAGFNLGVYKSVSVAHDPYRVTVYANRRLESALLPKPMPSAPDQIALSRSRVPNPSASMVQPPPVPNPLARLQDLATNIAAALDFMAAQFGPPPIKSLLVAPIPGGFGQGFPGLLYLSTLAYLDPSQRPAGARDRIQETFFSEMLDAHEVAHQWWGNLVVARSYQDAWLMEALANYSALLYIEKKKGPRAVETLLDDYRNHLLIKEQNGKTLESAGPITWGYRLQSSAAPDAWHYITYEKGAWVMHMLRRKLGDDRFMAMLRALCERYRYKPVTTDQFQKLAAEFLPPHSSDPDLASFFENWVYGTGIPQISMTYAVRGLKVTGSVVQSGVSEDFTARVPIEVQVGRQRTLYWVVTSSEPVPFTIAVKAPPSKVALAVKDALITSKK